MKRIKWIVIIITLLIIITPVSVYGYVKYKNYSLEKATQQYLMDKGYEEEIISIEAKLKKLSLFTAEVTFKDEPDIIYNYKKEDSKIIQIGPESYRENYEFKHLEE